VREEPTTQQQTEIIVDDDLPPQAPPTGNGQPGEIRPIETLPATTAPTVTETTETTATPTERPTERPAETTAAQGETPASPADGGQPGAIPPNGPESAAAGAAPAAAAGEPYIPGGADPAVPPMPFVFGNELVPGGAAGEFIEMSDTGLPYGAWSFDDGAGEWVFEEYPPPAGVALPKTGNAGMDAAGLAILLCMTLLAGGSAIWLQLLRRS
jgi:hypothetical protein